MEIEELVANRLVELRKGVGLTQEELAEQSDLPAITVRRMEAGSSQTLSNLYQLAQGLGLPLHELVRDDSARASTTNARLQMCLEALGKEPQELTEFVCDLIEVTLSRLTQ